MINKNFGLQLKELRRKLNLSQIELSEKAFISRRKLIDIENGKINPNLEDLISLSSVLKEDIVKLFLEYKKFKDINLKKQIEQIEAKLSDMEYNSLLDNLYILENHKNINSFIKQYYYAILGFYYMKSDRTDIEKAIEYLTIALKINISSFAIDKFSEYKFSSFELRVLISLADCLRYRGNKSLYFNVCSFAFNRLSRIDISYFVITINYATMISMQKEYQTSIDILNNCIEVSSKYNIYTYLPFIYYLIYINYKKLENITEAEKYLNKSIFLCDCYKKFNLKNLIIKKTNYKN